MSYHDIDDVEVLRDALLRSEQEVATLGRENARLKGEIASFNAEKEVERRTSKREADAFEEHLRKKRKLQSKYDDDSKHLKHQPKRSQENPSPSAITESAKAADHVKVTSTSGLSMQVPDCRSSRNSPDIDSWNLRNDDDLFGPSQPEEPLSPSRADLAKRGDSCEGSVGKTQPKSQNQASTRQKNSGNLSKGQASGPRHPQTFEAPMITTVDKQRRLLDQSDPTKQVAAIPVKLRPENMLEPSKGPSQWELLQRHEAQKAKEKAEAHGSPTELTKEASNRDLLP
ncbi:uncharacterized protein KY384_008119 [Bacidia gigantensis]|uniref:uncharacterized protein n=1 Tax=Bacidia gigantensis TaxID=2732470 RepID=UPI001D03AA60|nr:uncharacterized protein KY384_008119 [Bacidia gigantensis]KAG8526690.1 hypothetical protein KY384_008119 [Bacidia gigantensis]